MSFRLLFEALPISFLILAVAFPSRAISLSDRAKLSCRTAFGNVGQVIVGVVPETILLAKEIRNPEKRVLWVKETKISPTLGAVDNLVTPAGQSLIFSRELVKPGTDAERAFAERWLTHPRVLTPRLDASRLPESLIRRLEEAETRYLISAGVVLAAVTPNERARFQEEYVPGLLKFAHGYLSDLLKARRISPHERDEAASQLADIRIPPGHALAEAEAGDFWLLREAFVQAVRGKSTFHAAMEAGASYVEKELLDLPVGVSLQFAELNNAVRWGETYFFGSHGDHKRVSRRTFQKEAEKLGGYVEAVLNLSLAQKKRLAILIDRSQGRGGLFDRFFHEEACGKGVHLCGTYPPAQFLRAGFPYVSPVLSTPELQFFSLGLQRALRIPTVRSIDFRPSSTFLKNLPLSVAHSLIITEPETALLAGAIAILWYQLSSGDDDDHGPASAETSLVKLSHRRQAKVANPRTRSN